MRNKILYLFIATFLLVGLGNASAQATQWTYAMKSNGVTYKVNIQEKDGTVTIQLYDSKSNKWGRATVLEKKVNSDDRYTYYKIKTDYIYEIWIPFFTYDNSITVKGNGGEWKYTLESME
jgi:hypothetical protein